MTYVIKLPIIGPCSLCGKKTKNKLFQANGKWTLKWLCKKCTTKMIKYNLINEGPHLMGFEGKTNGTK